MYAFTQLDCGPHLHVCDHIGNASFQPAPMSIGTWRPPDHHLCDIRRQSSWHRLTRGLARLQTSGHCAWLPYSLLRANIHGPNCAARPKPSSISRKKRKWSLVFRAPMLTVWGLRSNKHILASMILVPSLYSIRSPKPRTSEPDHPDESRSLASEGPYVIPVFISFSGSFAFDSPCFWPLSLLYP